MLQPSPTNISTGDFSDLEYTRLELDSSGHLDSSTDSANVHSKTIRMETSMGDNYKSKLTNYNSFVRLFFCFFI